MFLGNFMFAVSHLKMHPAANLNTLKALTSCIRKEKFLKRLLAFIILPCFNSC